jgi:hypothetical protein
MCLKFRGAQKTNDSQIKTEILKFIWACRKIRFGKKLCRCIKIKKSSFFFPHPVEHCTTFRTPLENRTPPLGNPAVHSRYSKLEWSFESGRQEGGGGEGGGGGGGGGVRKRLCRRNSLPKNSQFVFHLRPIFLTHFVE